MCPKQYINGARKGLALGTLPHGSICLNWQDDPVKPSRVSPVARSKRTDFRGRVSDHVDRVGSCEIDPRSSAAGH